MNNIAEVILAEIEKRRLRRNTFRALRDNSNPFELPEDVFRSLYRLNVDAARDLFDEILPFLNDGIRNTKTPPVVRFFITLHFLAHGSYQKSVGQDCLNGSSQSNVSRYLHEIVNVMVDNLVNRYVRFPQNLQEIVAVKNGFHDKFHIPGIIGCIDCTHVKIVPPCAGALGYPPNVFMNRKNFYSINCQIICDVNCKILATNAQFPGSVHDAAIWRMSNCKMILHRKFLNGDNQTYLIGDSGYPLLPYLLTPIIGAEPNTPEQRYTQRHVQIRNCIERTNGLLKGIWRCLHPDRVLHYHPAFVSRIVYACIILHNIIRIRNIPFDENLIIIPNNNIDIVNDEEINDAQLMVRGQAIRTRIVQNFFN